MINLDKKDFKILLELDKNARQTDSKIAKKIGLSKQVVNYRIKNLIKDELITKFYTLVNVGFGIFSRREWSKTVDADSGNGLHSSAK